MQRQELLGDHLGPGLVVQAVRVLLRRVDLRLLGGDLRLLEEHVVGGPLLRALGDELHADGRRRLPEGRNPRQLDAAAHRQLEDAVGRRHARRLVHVELLDDGGMGE